MAGKPPIPLLAASATDAKGGGDVKGDWRLDVAMPFRIHHLFLTFAALREILFFYALPSTPFLPEFSKSSPLEIIRAHHHPKFDIGIESEEPGLG
jgi:hypothetical protein